MNAKMIELLKESHGKLTGPEGLDEQELTAKVALNDAIKTYDKIRTKREMVIDRVTQIVGMAD